MNTHETWASLCPTTPRTVSLNRSQRIRRVATWFSNRGVAALVLALVLGVIQTTMVGATAPDSGAIKEVPNLSPGNAEIDIDAFWNRMFTTAGIAYTAPAVVPFSAPVSSGCGYVTPAQVIAFHCMVDGAIYWSTPSYDASYVGGGDAAWINVMAHEWSHHAQVFLGTNTAWRQANDMVNLELEATCMGGAYVDFARDRGLVTDDMIGVMIGMFVGDAAHGTTEQVQASFGTGLDAGLEGCGVALPEEALAAASETDTVAVADATSDTVGLAKTTAQSETQTARVTAAGVNLRARPSLTATVNEVLAPSSPLEITGKPKTADGFTWYPVKDTVTGETGFVAAQFLDL